MLQRVSEYTGRNMTQGYTYMVADTQFVQTYTDADEVKNGETLLVVNESTSKVAGYYIAFNGKWVSL